MAEAFGVAGHLEVTARVCGPQREVTAEHASKRTMRRPTRLQSRGRLIRLGETSEDDAQPLHRVLAAARTQGKARAQRRGSPKAWSGQMMTGPTGRPVRDRPGAVGCSGEVRSTAETG